MHILTKINTIIKNIYNLYIPHLYCIINHYELENQVKNMKKVFVFIICFTLFFLEASCSVRSNNVYKSLVFNNYISRDSLFENISNIIENNKIKEVIIISYIKDGDSDKYNFSYKNDIIKMLNGKNISYRLVQSYDNKDESYMELIFYRYSTLYNILINYLIIDF